MADGQVSIEVLFRRLAARGQVSIDTVAEGVHVAWWPFGQRRNPWPSKGCIRPTLREALEEVVERTTPPNLSIDQLAWERERLRPCTCKHHGWFPRGDDGLDCPVHLHPKRELADAES